MVYFEQWVDMKTWYSILRKHMVLTSACGRSCNQPHRQTHTGVLVRDHLSFYFLFIFTQSNHTLAHAYLVDFFFKETFKWSSASDGIQTQNPPISRILTIRLSPTTLLKTCNKLRWVS